MSASPRTLRIGFDSEDAFQREYTENIANGGIFIETNVDFDVRESVRVEVQLEYLSESVSLDAEVVHVVTAEVAKASRGALPGVALQFAPKAREIREIFSAFIGGGGEDETEGRTGQRRSRRTRAQLGANLRVEGGADREIRAETRDLSRHGALIAVDGVAVPVGQELRLTLCHPDGKADVEVAGTVVRHRTNEDGSVKAIAVEFGQAAASNSELMEFVDDVRVREFQRQLGGISGGISELGIDNLLQMFATCSPCGILTVFRGAEEGFIVFESGMLRQVCLGEARGRKALARMLAWKDGTFEFHATTDSELMVDPPIPLNAALLDAMQQLDEWRSLDRANLPEAATLTVKHPVADASGVDLSKAESAIVELAEVGLPIGKIVDVIPEPDTEIYLLMNSLIERGLISVVD